MASKPVSSSVTNASVDHSVESKEQSSEFTDISLGSEKTKKAKKLVLKDPADPDYKVKEGKKPRKVLHFSDGTLEEYSETEDEDEVDNRPKIDPKKLKWLPWFWYYMSVFGNKSLGAADICGEKLAWFFGITSPKYQYAIDQYNKLQIEEEEEKAREERELKAFQERYLSGSHPDVEALDSVPQVAFTNKAFLLNEDSKSDATKPNDTDKNTAKHNTDFNSANKF